VNREAVRALIEDVGIVPAMRASSADDARFVAGAVAEAGIPIIEITMTTPGAVSVIAEVAKTRPDIAVGAGTVLDVATAERCIEAGADLVKIFPCAPWDGVAYLKSLLGPFPSVRFIASGGVNQQSAGDFMRAGAVAVGVGSELLPRQAVQALDQRWITELARRFLAVIQEARGSRTPHADLLDRR
jgi:2-dehydro-3-deoxyphosphogluconate aldolase / (4S)-4-hydroxy-2-oxoglutarate aldolase